MSKSNVDQALTKALNAAIEVRGAFRFGDEPAVNVVFVVPGSLGGSDVDFLREGKFSPKDKILLVEVPVPPSIMSNQSFTSFVVESLHGANAVAFEFYHRRGKEQFELEKAEAIVRKIRDVLMG